MRLCLCVLGGLGLFSQTLSATTYLYNNLGEPGDTIGSGFWIDFGTIIATEFDASASGALGSIKLSVGDFSPGSAINLTMGLYTNASGRPGTLLESWNPLVPANTGSPAPLTVLASLLDPSITSGTEYCSLSIRGMPRWSGGGTTRALAAGHGPAIAYLACRRSPPPPPLLPFSWMPRFRNRAPE